MGRRQHGQAQLAGSPTPFRPTLTQMANYLFAAAAGGLAMLYLTHQSNQDSREARIAVERLTSDLETLMDTTDRQDREIRELRHYMFSAVYKPHLSNERNPSWLVSPATPITPATSRGPVSDLRNEHGELRHHIAPVASECEPTGIASGGGSADASPPSDVSRTAHDAPPSP